MSWDRCRCNPILPERSTANFTRVLQPSPSAARARRFDVHPTLDAGHPAELFGNQLGLQPSLAGDRDVLPVTAPALPWAGVGTRWCTSGRPTPRSPPPHRPGGRRRSLRSPRPLPVRPEAMSDEHHPPVGGPGNASTTSGHRSATSSMYAPTAWAGPASDGRSAPSRGHRLTARGWAGASHCGLSTPGGRRQVSAGAGTGHSRIR